MEKHINVKSCWGTTAQNEYINRQGNNKLAVILPGRGYTNKAPFLYYPRSIAFESGYDALAVEYGFQRGGGEFVPGKESLDHLVKEVKEAVKICLEEKDYKEILFVGKSLGTLIEIRLTDEFPEYPQRHIFITPLPESISVIKRTDCMVIAGTNDRVINSEHLNEITGLKNVTLVLLEGADHSMEKGNHKEDLMILTEVCRNIYGFINKQA